MKTSTCECGQLLFFENIACVECKREVGFLPDLICISSLEPAQNDLFKPTAQEAKDRLYRKCQNYSTVGVCNWMVRDDATEPFCVSCRLDTVIPDLTVPQNVVLWGLMEAAKRRLVYSSLRMKLPLANRVDDPEGGLGFRFLADVKKPDGTIEHVITEHDHGLITLNLVEADDAAREKIRLGMKEPYRTLLGHFRHETGHFIWNKMVRDSGKTQSFRAVFGDESVDYQQALDHHYKSGPPRGWGSHYISYYATTHPWEDFAECFAHVLHIVDSLETAHMFGIALAPSDRGAVVAACADFDPYSVLDFERIAEVWVPLSMALNTIHRSMGERDLYPFVLTPVIKQKLGFVHGLLTRQI